ncbi:helix-turn-helix domain-containing protein [Rhodocyclus tenuis]|uniref:Winged helix-turn-helix domain-containing protein n=1 Tax=Rhodocyclus tenuis TaxID=1066 RepID=A0A840GC34_RHOTE|nr:helix-turn-helix domain-containing protein [Rhodocyclus tenuis]MBB4249031.1 hypothetical protein [Rhodocyclus tenuis]
MSAQVTFEARQAPADSAYPRCSSVKGRVLAALLRGESITHLDCWRRFSSSRLSHHIYMLRAVGWPIDCTEEPVPTSDGRTAIIGRYSLPQSAIGEAGEGGQRYAGLLL